MKLFVINLVFTFQANKKKDEGRKLDMNDYIDKFSKRWESRDAVKPDVMNHIFPYDPSHNPLFSPHFPLFSSALQLLLFCCGFCFPGYICLVLFHSPFGRYLMGIFLKY